LRFWDASAVVPLLLAEGATRAMRALVSEDGQMAVWAMTPLEVLSALWRRRRLAEIEARAHAAAEQALTHLEAAWSIVADVAQVERRARRLLASHPLRAADAAQLAAALLACDETPEWLPFVTLDERLAEAARREGFAVLPS
jgi:predicted nucleic acid-binding protein